MNILPTVLFFIMLFAMLSYSLIDNTHMFKAECKAKIGYMQAQRKTRLEAEKTVYNALPKKTSEAPKLKPSSSPSSTTPKESHFHRSEYALSQPLNLFPLFAEEPFNKTYYTICLNLLKACYTSLESDLSSSINLEALFQSILTQGQTTYKQSKKKQIPFIMDLKEIVLSDAKHSQAYYKMLRGTRLFDLATKDGFPPLELMFTIDPKAKESPLHFKDLSHFMLNIIFNPSTAQKILKKEAAKRLSSPKTHPFLKKEELEAILQEDIASNTMLDLLKCIDFQSNKKSLSITCIAIDKETSIKEERTL